MKASRPVCDPKVLFRFMEEAHAEDIIKGERVVRLELSNGGQSGTYTCEEMVNNGKPIINKDKL